MNETKLYCPVCQKHTQHVPHVAMYASACTACHTYTSQLARNQAEAYTYEAPDGTMAQVVENNPDNVTFYIESGEYKGYYHYDKHTQNKWIDTV
jgi:ribosomal protein L33